VAYGFTARSSLFAVKHLRKQGKKIGLLRLKTIWPFPEEEISGLGKTAQKVFVPEMNSGQVAGEVKKFYSGPVQCLSQMDGEVIRPEIILEFLQRNNI